MIETHPARVEAFQKKYSPRFPSSLAFAVGPMFRNLDRLPRVSEAEQKIILPTLIREFLIITGDPDTEVDPTFIAEFSDLLESNVSTLIKMYAPEYSVEEA